MIKIDTDEVLRYLGRKKSQPADAESVALAENAAAKIEQVIQPRYLYAAIALEWSERLMLAGSDIELAGSSITKHLAGCAECVIMAATLGIDVDKLIRSEQTRSMTNALALDAAATAAIEAVCDECESEIRQVYGCCTSRFSPGYGDLPLSLQKPLLSLLNAEKRIGLQATSADILIPRKSVTAILGIGREAAVKNKCINCCNRKDCAYSEHS